MNRTDSASAGSDQDPIAAIAGEWVARHDRGLSSEEEADFSRWLASDPRHAAAFANLQSAWASLDALSALRPNNRIPADPDLLRVSVERTRRRWWRPILVMAAAAAVILFIFATVVSRRKSTQAVEVTRYETVLGGQRRIQLADGSILQLNTQSTVEVSFSSNQRSVRLTRGEVYFTVAKDVDRPFVVAAGSVRVRAVGTEFDVDQRGNRVDVFLTEGQVRIDHSITGRTPAGATLLAGQRATVDLAAAEPDVQIAAFLPDEIARKLAWKEHRLEFAETPLAEAVEEFNRYNSQKLAIADHETGRLKIGGSFRPDNVDAFVRLLEGSFGVVAERHDARTTILHKSK